ncbi:TraR/DksA C4-type zinc finger protein [Microbacterium sp. M28]|uniref:TraR/DksA family transcriptional regulator n=1 Tax=Microbacterium sp. M28 TaxID=2962064 RepID=UPI0021F485AC|nr:TraR/DksA C4-type zinc finger protein [Microbacterium sp. M28]UYO96917.1 TraR/DksA C4-type zinc finger protein [Microbacterium sp. M28]
MTVDPRIRLEELRVDALARAESAITALTQLTHDREGANDDDEHDPEGVTLSSEWSRLTGLAEAAQAELRQVEDALTRVDAGTYGVCTACGNGIPPERLEVRPFAELCVPCAERSGR